MEQPKRDRRVVSMADATRDMRDKVRLIPGASGSQADLEVYRQCDTCGGFGVVTKNVPTNHPDFGKSYPCPKETCAAGQEKRELAWRTRLESAQIPDAYRRFTFQSFEALPDEQINGKWLAYAACKMFVQSRGHWVSVAGCYNYLNRPWDGEDIVKNSLMLFGPVGTAKTGLAIAAANALMAQREAVLYVRARDLIAEIQRRYSQHNDDTPAPAEEVLTLFKQAPILIIDEFNVENPSPDRREIFESLMRYRSSNELPTIMTANVDQQKFTDMWKERTADVVIAMAHWIPVAGEKLRRTNGPLEAI